MGDEDFLADMEAENAAETTSPKEDPAKEPEKAPEPGKADEQQPREDQPRDSSGKFTPKAAEPSPQADPPRQQPDPGFVPIAAMLDERDRRAAAEARLRHIEDLQRQANQQPVQLPDMILDPEGYHAFVTGQVEQRVYQDRLFMSERLARIEHGSEVFEKAKEWGYAKCDTDPYFNQRVRQSQDPYGVVMEEWRREQAAGIPATELEEFRAWKTAQAALQTQQQPGAAPATATAPPILSIPPRSLASAPSSGGDMLREPPKSDGEVFEEVFPT